MDRVVDSLLDPVIIFIVLGVAIGFLRSNREMPQAGRDSTDDRVAVQRFAA